MKPTQKSNAKPRDIVINTLGKMIVSGEFIQGSRLPTEADLGEKLSVSRTALREAVRMLAGKGLVESRPRIGTIVLPQSQWNQLDSDLLQWREDLPPDLTFLRSLIEARAVIEPAAAKLAAQRASGQDLGRIQSAYEAMCVANTKDIESNVVADEAFHSAILMASQNPVFATFASVIGSALRSSFRLTTKATENFRMTLEKHANVLEAIRMRDGETAERLMSELIAAANADLARLSNIKGAS